MKRVPLGILASAVILCAAAGMGQAPRPAASHPATDPTARDVGFRPASPASTGSSLEALAAGAPPIFGSIETVQTGGAPEQLFALRANAFLGVGPTSSPCQFAAYLPDGSYYFQVTDSSGRRLLSADPVSERAFTVTGGVIASYDGTTHAVGGKTICGSLAVGLLPYNDAGSMQALYVVWLTPAAAFQGTPTQIDRVCGTGCFHGFSTDLSLTSAFRVEDKASCDPSFCASGIAFNDLNGNGIRDAGEPGLGGVPVRVESASGLVLTTVTAHDGSFQICGLTSGDALRVTSPAPLGFNKTGPVNATVAPRVFAKDFAYIIEVCLANQSNLLFPNQAIPGTIEGLKFQDTNANGVRDPGEPGLSGVTISLFPSTGRTPPTTTITDASGNFLFTNVAAGDYALFETVPSGFTQTAPASGGILLTLAANGSSLDNLFGNFPGLITGTISGTKFNDLNGNGVRDPGEAGIAGVRFYLNDCQFPCGLPPVAVTESGSDGSFSFTGILLRSVPYFLSEAVPSGFRQTTPAMVQIPVTVDLEHQTAAGLLFGNQAVSSSISGMKFLDTNGNGVFDAGEAGLGNVTIQLTTPAGSLVATTTTGPSGGFQFDRVAPGQYLVSEVVPAGFVQTAPPAPGTIAVIVTAGVPATGLLFGNNTTLARGTGSISGTKYFDIDANGVVDIPPDRPLQGVTINLTDSSGHTQTTISAADGTFKFSSLAPGTYTLSETIPPGFAQTLPGTPDHPKSYTITLAPGQNAAGYLFLNKC